MLVQYDEGNQEKCGECNLKKRDDRVSGEELFTRRNYYGTDHLNRKEDEVWLMPIGYLMDLWECHKQFIGTTKPKLNLSIDDVIPSWA